VRSIRWHNLDTSDREGVSNSVSSSPTNDRLSVDSRSPGATLKFPAIDGRQQSMSRRSRSATSSLRTTNDWISARTQRNAGYGQQDFSNAGKNHLPPWSLDPYDDPQKQIWNGLLSYRDGMIPGTRSFWVGLRWM
jgi:hypothetical protein